MGSKQAVFSGLLERHHYPGHRGTAGENLQYLVSDRQGNALACVLFGAAAWQCKARDQEVGWDAANACVGAFVCDQQHTLSDPAMVRVPHLANYVPGRIARRLCGDWQEKYGHRVTSDS